MTTHQSYYQCVSCFCIGFLEHPAGHPEQPVLAGPFRDCKKKDNCQLSGITAKHCDGGADAYVAYFSCDTCSARVVMAIFDERVRFGRSYLRYHAGCNGRLTYLSSAPRESHDAYHTHERWDAVRTHIALTRAPREEKDSQKNVRAYLIRKGYLFLSGQGSLDFVALNQTEFATFHPLYSVEEPAFARNAFRQSVILTPRVAYGYLDRSASGVTWPDFVVCDGPNKIAIELKTPKSYVQGTGQRPIHNSGDTVGRTINLGKGKTVCVGQEFGMIGAWMLQYWEDVHKEAVGRKANMPQDYKNIFLIDLDAVGASPQEATEDLKTLSGQTAYDKDGLCVYSKQWWEKYWDSIQFFHGGEMLDSELLAGRFAGPRFTYDQIADQFKARTVCLKCNGHVPQEERNEWGVCRFCIRAAQMLCGHPKLAPREIQSGICLICLAALLSSQ